jgi:hypothetical protein
MVESSFVHADLYGEVIQLPDPFKVEVVALDPNSPNEVKIRKSKGFLETRERQ